MGKISNAIGKVYFSLPPKRRRVYGWMVLILLVGTLSWGTYGLYQGAKATYQYVCGWWYEDVAVEGSEEEYSGDASHRTFVITNKHPKRHIRDYGRLFDDLNDTQLAAARRLGVTPVNNREDAEKHLDKLVRLHDTHYYKIDHLTQSIPYLVPDAADFLTALGRLMQEYNGTPSRYIITSVMRTQADVKELRRTNVNASVSSCHCYGTTVDITYVRWDRRGKTWDSQLKLDLARALADMRDAGYCYVKYEVRQSCFHVTVRPRR